MLHVNFDLGRLSDRMLQMFLDTSLSEEKKALASDFLHAVQTAFLEEQLRRSSRKSGPEPRARVQIVLPCMGMEEIVAAALNLYDSSAALEGAAVLMEASDPALSDEYRTGAEFCNALDCALREQGRGLVRAEGAGAN